MPLRYAELSPKALETAIRNKRLAILPIGALEWHGPHLPLGLDGIVAESFCANLAERSGGVLLPCLWTPITTLPHPYSIDMPSDLITPMMGGLFRRLGVMGFTAICCVSGHYAQGHMVCLYQTALQAMGNHPGLSVLCASPLEVLGDDSLLDHAALWEAAQLLPIRPELVHLEALPQNLSPKTAGVLGEDPSRATAEMGSVVLRQALNGWATWIERMLSGQTEAVREFLEGRTRSYDAYVARYKPEGATWDDAILSWWAEQR